MMSRRDTINGPIICTYLLLYLLFILSALFNAFMCDIVVQYDFCGFHALQNVGMLEFTKKKNGGIVDKQLFYILFMKQYV